MREPDGRRVFLSLEPDRRADLDDAPQENPRCVAEGRKRRTLAQDRVRVERIEEVQVHSRPRAAKSEDLSDAEVDLMHPLTV